MLVYNTITEARSPVKGGASWGLAGRFDGFLETSAVRSTAEAEDPG
jgi:hypothetical protein